MGALSDRRRSAPVEPIYRDGVFSRLGPHQFPHLAAVSDRWASLTSADIYSEGVRTLTRELLAN